MARGLTEFCRRSTTVVTVATTVVLLVCVLMYVLRHFATCNFTSTCLSYFTTNNTVKRAVTEIPIDADDVFVKQSTLFNK